MTTYRVETPTEPEEGLRVVCEQHGHAESFEPGYQQVAFHCPSCEIELGVSIEDLAEWRELSEMC